MDNQVKLYPKLAMFILIMISVFGAIMFLIIMPFILKGIELYVIIFFIGFAIIMVTVALLTDSIILTEDKLVIKADFNKTIIYIAEIKYISYAHMSLYDFSLGLHQNNEDIDYFLTNNKYYKKDCLKLFHLMNEKYNIPLKDFPDQ